MAPRRRWALDVGAGNGQAAVALGRFFERVVATDPSVSQLAVMGTKGHGARGEGSLWRVGARAEALALGSGWADLITVAQALHWFDLDAFWEQVRRMARPGGVVAVWTYGLLRLDDGGPRDQVLADFYQRVVGPFWPVQRRHVDGAYGSLPFPFPRIDVRPPPMTARWSREQLLGYVATWSAVRRYRDAEGDDPMVPLAAAMARAWPDGPRELVWPLTLRVGRVGG